MRPIRKASTVERLSTEVTVIATAILGKTGCVSRIRGAENAKGRNCNSNGEVGGIIGGPEATEKVDRNELTIARSRRKKSS